MIGEGLPYPDPRIAVVDVNLHLHLGERQNARIGSIFIAGNQHTAVGLRGRSQSEASNGDRQKEEIAGAFEVHGDSALHCNAFLRNRR